MIFMKMSVRENVNSILLEKQTQSKEDLEVKFKEFKTKYPGFFDMLFEPNLNFEQLKFILDKYENVENGNQSFDNASVEVGQKFFDYYVKPKVDELDKNR
jgi:hypothetical protein